MKTKEFNKTIQELNKKIEENNEQIYICDERSRMAYVNRLEYKLMLTIGFSMVPYICFAIGSKILDKYYISTLINFIPPYIIPIIIVGSSLGLGAFGTKLMNKKYKSKERYESFSKATTKTEKIEEEINYQIELEKALNKNKAIEKTIQLLENNNKTLRRLSNKYDINEKNIPSSKEELIEISEKLSTILEKKYNELDILSTQKILHNSFWRLRSKSQKIIEIFLVIMGSGAGLMGFTSMPIIGMINIYASLSELAKNLMVYIPFVTGALTSGIYLKKRNSKQQKVFEILNSKLGENALPKKVKVPYDEQKEIDNLIESKISDISAVEIQLKETERALETIVEKETKTQEKHNSYKFHPIEDEEFRLYLEEELAPLKLDSIFESSEDLDEEQDTTYVRRKIKYSNNK